MNKIYTLPGGLRLVLNDMETTRSAAVGVYVATGAANENSARSGISHFIEHMLFKRTHKRTAYDIADEMESLGVQINAFTARHMTSYYTISTYEHVDACMELLSDIFFNSVFDSEDMAREKQVVLEEISRSEDDPEDVCFDGLAKAFYGDTPMGRPILGYADNVRSFTREDIRSYMDEFYVAPNTVISVAGKFDHEVAEGLVNKYFADKFLPKPAPADVTKVETQSRLFFKEKPTEQANIAFMFPSYTYGDDRLYAAMLLSNVFGGGMSSRLFQNVRERRGLAYDIYSLTSAMKANGCFEIFVGTNPKTAKIAVDAIREEILLLLDKGITEREFSKGKEQLKAGNVLGAESAVSLMRANAKSVVMTGEVYDLDESLAKINALTMSDIRNAVEDIFDFGKVAAGYVGVTPDFDVLASVKGV